MHIATANPASPHANQHLASPRRRRSHLRHLQLPVFRQQQSLHRASFHPEQIRKRHYSNPFGVRWSFRFHTVRTPPQSILPSEPRFLRALCAPLSVSSVLKPFSSLLTAGNSSRKFQSTRKNFVSSYRYFALLNL